MGREIDLIGQSRGQYIYPKISYFTMWLNAVSVSKDQISYKQRIIQKVIGPESIKTWLTNTQIDNIEPIRFILRAEGFWPFGRKLLTICKF